jgi:hypothetical protein
MITSFTMIIIISADLNSLDQFIYSVRHNRFFSIIETIKSTINFHQNFNFIRFITFDLQDKNCCIFCSTCTLLSFLFHDKKAKSNFASFKSFPYIDFKQPKKSNFKPKYLYNRLSDIQDMHIPMISKLAPFIWDLFYFSQ